MSGHSKWSTIKRKKGINDLTRAKVFTKLLFQISNAVKSGNSGSRGEDLNSNYALKLAINKAREANIPISTIEGVIKKASLGGSDNDTEDVEYEVYIPLNQYDGSQLNVELLIDCQTSNKNRLVAEIREVVSKNGGKLLSQGSISWNFLPLDLITLKIENPHIRKISKKNKINIDEIKGKYIQNISSFEEELVSIDGIYDYEYDGVELGSDQYNEFRVYTTKDNTNKVKDALLDMGYLIDNIENVKVAKNKLKFKDLDLLDLDSKDIFLSKISTFVDAIESVDGVISTYLNI